MKIAPVEPPRRFSAGRPGARVTMADCARIALAPDEQVTFTTEAGGEYDVARKSWGFYATPSLAGRLPAHGLRPALCVNPAGQSYVLLVERGAEDAFAAYLAEQEMRRLAWLDDPEVVARLDDREGGGDSDGGAG